MNGEDIVDSKIEKQLAQIVCICKGINLKRVLRGLLQAKTVHDVNRTVGTGSGGCKGTRCGPRIQVLLEKKKNMNPKDNPPSANL